MNTDRLEIDHLRRLLQRERAENVRLRDLLRGTERVRVGEIEIEVPKRRKGDNNEIVS